MSAAGLDKCRRAEDGGSYQQLSKSGKINLWFGFEALVPQMRHL